MKKLLGTCCSLKRNRGCFTNISGIVSWLVRDLKLHFLVDSNFKFLLTLSEQEEEDIDVGQDDHFCLSTVHIHITN